MTNAEHKETPSAETPAAVEELVWVSHPMKRRPLIAALVTLFIFACGALIQVSTNSPWFAGLGMVVLFASLAKFYFPTKYVLTSEGVTIKTTTQSLSKPWKMYRSYYRDKNGILLSPFAEPSRLENFRGLYLIFDKNGDEVTRCIARHISENTDDDASKKTNE